MKGILKIAFKLLVNDRDKFAALIVGITFAVFIMVRLTSVFAGILSKAPAHSQLVRQRPDILAAEATLHSGSANIGVATAAMFPNITLSGASGQYITDIAQLFGATGNFWSIGAAVPNPSCAAGPCGINARPRLQPITPPCLITGR